MIKSFYISLENSEDWENSADWGIFISKWKFPDAKIKENVISIPGYNGVIDLSEELTGDVVFNNVRGEISFIILRNSCFDYHYFKNKYHGMRVKIMSDQEADFYRIGRLTIADDNQQDVLKKISMNIDADPFKYCVQEKKLNIPITEVKESLSDFEYFGVDKDGFSTSYDSESQKITITKETAAGGLKVFPKYDSVAKFSISQNTRYSFVCDINVKQKNPYDTINISSASLFLFTKESVRREVDNINDFNSKDAVRAGLRIFLEIYREYATHVPGIDTQIEFSNFKLIPLFESQKLEIKNNGRKNVVPTVISNTDGKLVVNGKTTNLISGTQTLIFDVDLKRGDNTVVAYGDNGGEATLSFREAYL